MPDQNWRQEIPVNAQCVGSAMPPEEFRGWWGRDKHCAEDEGGSHYHCGRCGAVTSMYGHQTTGECDEARSMGWDRPEFVSSPSEGQHD